MEKSDFKDYILAESSNKFEHIVRFGTTDEKHEFLNHADFDCQMTDVTKVKSENSFELRFLFKYTWLINQPPMGNEIDKLELIGDYMFGIVTHKGTLFNDIYSKEAAECREFLIRKVFEGMKEYADNNEGCKNLFPIPPDDDIIALSKAIAFSRID